MTAEQNTRLKIIQNAIRLFGDNGYQSTSVNQISKAAGITKGGFYYFFETKLELLRTCLDEYIFEFAETYNRVLDEHEGSVAELLEKLIYLEKEMTEFFSDEFIAQGFSFRTYYMMIFEGIREFDFIRERLSNVYMKMIRRFKEILDQGIEQGEIVSNCDTEAIAIELVTSSEGIILVWLITDEIDPLDSLIRVTNSIFSRILVKNENK